jgi:hypothetical protein
VLCMFSTTLGADDEITVYLTYQVSKRYFLLRSRNQSPVVGIWSVTRSDALRSSSLYSLKPS